MWRFTTLLVLLCLAVPCCFAKHHYLAWRFGRDYESWNSLRKFHVGDSITFGYRAENHSVAEVSESDYKRCTTRADTMGADDRIGGSRIGLESAGTRYFISTMRGDCEVGGMKLAVTTTNEGSRRIVTSMRVVMRSCSTADASMWPTSTSSSLFNVPFVPTLVASFLLLYVFMLV